MFIIFEGLFSKTPTPFYIQLQELCRQVIEENEKICADYRSGKEKAIMPLVGAVMKKSKGRADASAAKQMLEGLLRGQI